jgi:hypothetical protein
LYLAVAFLFFFAWPHTPLESALENAVAGALHSHLESQGLPLNDEGRVDLEDPVVQESSGVVFRTLPVALLILFVPVFAGLFFVVNRGQGRFVGNLVTALHFHSVAFLCLVVTAPLTLVVGDDLAEWGMLVILLALLAFLAVSVKRIHGIGTVGALFRTLLVALVYPFFVFITIVGVLVIWWSMTPD